MLEEEKKIIEKQPSLALQENTIGLVRKMHKLAYIRKKKVKRGLNWFDKVSCELMVNFRCFIYKLLHIILCF
jgi:hypothetical protein